MTTLLLGRNLTKNTILDFLSLAFVAIKAPQELQQTVQVVTKDEDFRHHFFGNHQVVYVRPAESIISAHKAVAARHEGSCVACIYLVG